LIAPCSKPRAGVPLVVVGVVVGLAVSCNGFREDEVDCERAVIHLRDCCGGSDVTLDCTYANHVDCNGTTTDRDYPALSTDDSQCLMRTSCADLIARDVCKRAQNLQPRNVEGDTGSEPPSSDLCAP
jgi:hypothetical protein